MFSTTVHAEKINLNTADADTIQYIPGVGPSKAQRMVAARTQNGKFESMDQIDAIKGFGERTMIDVMKHGSLDSGVSELTPEMEENQPGRSVSKVSNETAGSAS
jgi:competence ComEA-like helix-hairpin-helix protein